MLKISAFGFGTVGMHRRMLASADKFLAMVTEGAVHSVYKVCDSVFEPDTVVGGQEAFHPMPITVGYITCSVMGNTKSRKI